MENITVNKNSSFFSKTLLVLGNLYFISLFVSISAMELFQFLLMLLTAYELFIHKKIAPLPLKPILFGTITCFILFLIPLLSTNSFALSIEQSASILRWFFPLILLSYFFYRQDQASIYWKFLPWFIFVFGLYSIFESFTGIDLFHKSNEALHPMNEQFRAAGTFDNPMTFAQSFGISFLFYTGVLFSNPKFYPRLQKTIFYVGFILCLIMSMVRGMWIGASLGMLVMAYLISWKQVAKVLISICLILGSLKIVLPKFFDRAKSSVEVQNDQNISREILWKTYIEIWKTSPVSGVGLTRAYNMLPDYYEKLGIPKTAFKGEAHNQYIEYLSSLGILGLASYLLALGGMLYMAFYLWRKRDELQLTDIEKGLVLGAIGACIATIFCSLFEDNFDDTEVRNVIIFMWSFVIFITLKYKNKLILINKKIIKNN